jgi:hypothetical protein
MRDLCLRPVTKLALGREIGSRCRPSPRIVRDYAGEALRCPRIRDLHRSQWPDRRHRHHRRSRANGHVGNRGRLRRVHRGARNPGDHGEAQKHALPVHLRRLTDPTSTTAAGGQEFRSRAREGLVPAPPAPATASGAQRSRQRRIRWRLLLPRSGRVVVAGARYRTGRAAGARASTSRVLHSHESDSAWRLARVSRPDVRGDGAAGVARGPRCSQTVSSSSLSKQAFSMVEAERGRSDGRIRRTRRRGS